ncbi:MAG TPA: DUF2274 domain-containing protein [Steroidobacteraceae bacterium]|jgi:hypothetical protein|nr:DUF2274 domain-containing protein [Steroidobacteraceae bacterium]
MSKLKIGSVDDEKPVAITIKLSAAVHRDLVAYAEALKREGGQTVDPNLLIVPMLTRFMATDRAFRKARKQARKA